MGSSASAPRRPPLSARRAVFEGAAPSLSALAARLLSLRRRGVVVLVGAGASVSAGIPDFRTPGVGLYANAHRYGELPTPEAIFSLDFFRQNPRPFYRLARELLPGARAPTPLHYLLRLLDERGLLSRVYTQNIDGLERLAGVDPERLVEAHGGVAQSTCLRCRRAYDEAWLRAAMKLPGSSGSGGGGGSGDSGSGDDVVSPRCSCGGVVKTDIVFFGENLPRRFFETLAADTARADLLIVVGTSLKVFPVAAIPRLVPQLTPRLLINLQAVDEARCRGGDEESEEEVEEAAEVAAAAAVTTAAAGGGAAAASAASSAEVTRAAGGRRGGDDGEEEEDDDDGGDGSVDDELPPYRSNGFLFGAGSWRDVLLEGTCNDGAMRLAAELGWGEELAALRSRELIRLGLAPAPAVAAEPPAAGAGSADAGVAELARSMGDLALQHASGSSSSGGGGGSESGGVGTATSLSSI